MKVFCDVLASGKYIPTKCASKNVSGGQNLSLPILWTDIPADAKSFALSMVDQHPLARGLTHWVVINISPNARKISEGASQTRKLPPGSIELRNGFGNMGYTGPQLAKGSGPHEYLIMLYALNVSELQLGPVSPYDQFQLELTGKVLASASLVVVFG